ncbi:DEAD/DEAH box helicase [Lysinibacter cavernae]|uniref:DEAD/DEAH box helicase n=1 Tax=Lysinibacter cavernae TaxID=1640652 RepID=UPI0036139322
MINTSPPEPDAYFASMGFEIEIDPVSLPGVTCLQDLYTPIARLSSNGRTTHIRQRLAGLDQTKEWAGYGAIWDSEQKLVSMPAHDVFYKGLLRQNIFWDDASIQSAKTQYSRIPWQESTKVLAAILGQSLEMPADDTGADIGTLPEWFNMDLFKFQLPGALSVVAGHRMLADPPGVGKTIQAIAALSILDSKRSVVVCPPLLLGNWEVEVARSGLCDNPVIISPTKKVRPFPETQRPDTKSKRSKNDLSLPEKGVVVVADSLLTSRPELLQSLINWAPTGMLVDEAHRMRNAATKRSAATLDLAFALPSPAIPMTGTPTISGPQNLIPILELSGHLVPLFGGTHQFLETFCIPQYMATGQMTPSGQNRRKLIGWKARDAALPYLHQLLRDYVWVRRSKNDVLPFLPPRFHTAIKLDVDTKAYRDAHQSVIEAIDDWLVWFSGENNGLPPNDPIIEEFAGSQGFALTTKLRVASGLTKVKPTVELIVEHVADTDGDNPLIVWFHHLEFLTAVQSDLSQEGIKYETLSGGLSMNERERIVAAYQAGEIPVLFASLTAAGVGITLTRGCDALIAETDWTPANVSQALDRQHRIGQKRTVIARTLVAKGTLDETLQIVQDRKQTISGTVHGDRQDDVSVIDEIDEMQTAKDIIIALIKKQIQKSFKNRANTP